MEMLGRTNIFAFVGTGHNQKFPKNKVILWDDKFKQIIAEITFKSTIKAVKLFHNLYVFNEI